MLISELTPAAITAWLAALHDVLTAPGVEPIDYAITPIFAGISRYKVYWFHKQACARLKIDDLTVHDARHSLGVRWRKQGLPLEVIAAQLGPAYRAPCRADLWSLSADDGRAPGGGAFVSNTRRTATATTTSANSVFLTCNC